jgi:hypothetical protein
MDSSFAACVASLLMPGQTQCGFGGFKFGVSVGVGG